MNAYHLPAAVARASSGPTLIDNAPAAPEDGRIIAVLQHTALEPLAENNGALRGDRRHFMWFPKNETRDALVPTTYRIPELDKEGGDKVGMGAHGHHRRWRHWRPLLGRGQVPGVTNWSELCRAIWACAEGWAQG